MSERGTLSKQVALRLSPEDIDRLEGLTRRIGIASRNAVARRALRLGLQALENDPTQLLEGAPAKRSRRKK